MRSEFDARGARERAHAAFVGKAIRGITWHRPIFVDRIDVDDAAASALLQHLLGGNLSAEEGTLQGGLSTLSYWASVVSSVFDVRVPTPALFTMTMTRPNFAAATRPISFCNSATLLTSASTPMARSPNPRNLLFHCVGCFTGMKDVITHYAGTLSGEFQYNGLVNTRHATGDNSNFVLEQHVSLFRSCNHGFCERGLIRSSIVHFVEIERFL